MVVSSWLVLSRTICHVYHRNNLSSDNYKYSMCDESNRLTYDTKYDKCNHQTSSDYYISIRYHPLTFLYLFISGLECHSWLPYNHQMTLNMQHYDIFHLVVSCRCLLFQRFGSYHPQGSRYELMGESWRQSQEGLILLSWSYCLDYWGGTCHL